MTLFQGPRIKIAPSLLAADFSRLGEEIRRVESAGCDLLHVDVMDGHFVPNLSVGPVVLSAIRRTTRLALDTHLMIETPWKFIGEFARAGADTIIVHQEACKSRLAKTLKEIKSLGRRCGVSLRPQTSLNAIRSVLDITDYVHFMTVNPGFGGQAFMPSVMPKIRNLRKIFSGDIAVDGGINPETCELAARAGANIMIAGTAIFTQQDIPGAIQSIRSRSEAAISSWAGEGTRTGKKGNTNVAN